MTQIVEIPGIGQVEFPDGMSDDQISAAIRQNMPKESSASPLKIVGSTAVRGAAGLFGLPGDIFGMIGGGVGRAAEKLTGDKSYRSAFMPELKLGSEDIVRATEKLTGPLYQPKTAGGGILDETGRGAVMGAPGGLLGMTVGAASGFGSGIAGAATNQNPIAKIASGLLFGLGAGLPMAMRGSTGTVIADALQGVDDQTLKAAQSLMDDAARMGSPITAAEAIAQVKGGATPLTAVQRVVEQSRGGGPTMTNFMAQRPQQNRQAFESVVSRIAPEVADPTTIAPRVQGAATKTIDQARQAGNAAAAPLYASAQAQRIPANTWNSITADPAIASALQTVKRNPMLGLQNEAEGSVRWLDAAKKYLDELAAPSPVGASALERTSAASATRAASNLRGAVDNVAPDYAKARGIVEQNMRDVVEPLRRQPIGQLAEAATFPQQRQILFPQKPETLTPKLVTQTVRELIERDPQSARDMTRHFLQTQFDEITQNLVGGQNQFGGAKFAAQVAGNTKQAANLKAAVEALPEGDEVWKGFRRFLDIMEAQGKRQPMGSATEFNRQITDQLSRGGAIGEVATMGASPSKLMAAASDWWQQVKYGQNTKALADILTDPVGIEKMKLLAMMGPDSPRARTIALSFAVPAQDRK
jgi:hypothetical protein